MSKILVTGANGFIGQALCDSLEKQSHEVIKHTSREGDIVDENAISRYKSLEIKHIFHLASKTYVPDSWENPSLFYKTIVDGTLNILEFCRKEDVALTYISTFVYGKPEKLPVSENDQVEPSNPYAHAKYLAEELCRFYSTNYNVKITVVRPFNVYGKDQRKDFLIPMLIEQVLNAKEVEVKDLIPKRDYIYLQDLVEGLVKTLDTQKLFSIYNMGSGYSLSVKEVIDIIQKVAKTSKPVLSKNTTRKNEIDDVIADISLAKKELMWNPVYRFEDGIKEIIKGMYNEK